MSVIIALDQGTTSSRALAFDKAGQVLGIAQQEFQQHFPKPGWVEHDPEQIWQSQLDVVRQLLEKCNLSPKNVAAIGITNQRETTLVWDRQTGQPIHNAIVWQDRRTSEFCHSLNSQGYTSSIQAKTGLVVDPYFCATKLRWLLDQVPDARRRAGSGELAFGTVDSWLIWKLTGGREHLTDVTNASRTLLMNLESSSWDEEMLSLFDIPEPLLPEIRGSSEVYAETDPELFGEPIAIAGIAGDQQAALFGQNCTQNGRAKNTYGTGCFMLLNIGSEPQISQHRLLTTVAASAGTSKQYALEGSVFVAGAMVQWLRDGLKMIESSSDIELMAASVPDSGGVSIVPALAGLGAPHWDSSARGTILGLTRGTTTAHIARATLEGIALEITDVFEAMRNDTGLSISELRVDGGASNNDLLMQIQADLMQTPVVRPKITETTSQGAAYLAGLAVGYWDSVDEIETIWKVDSRFEPKMPPQEVQRHRDRWRHAIERAKGWETGEA